MHEHLYFSYITSKQFAELMKKIQEIEKENKKLKERLKEQK